ncbi:hypothetical protein H3V13_03715 [Bartonella sp. M0280]|uniref:hypothetical protein n=1 Tax=Bartonella apihabitans TaxID=2750929 RepID=UPI0018DDC3DB|nr:hypothetical protein [Bartonella apihabitans]MBI0167061.1 hypothetical protein [Bartonella apihabitans]
MILPIINPEIPEFVINQLEINPVICNLKTSNVLSAVYSALCFAFQAIGDELYTTVYG